MSVHFIDVGQGHATLVQSAGHNMLIDAGEADISFTLNEYLKEQDVLKLDYLIGTHPHADHIGGLSTVLESFPTDHIILPRVQTQTLVFEKLLLTIREKGLSITPAKTGVTFSLGEAVVTVLAPVNDYGDDLNNWSATFRIENGEDSFLIGGDAEEAAEEDMVDYWGEALLSDVLLLHHHGSDTSSSDPFLKSVAPRFAVISAGAKNPYGHPSERTLEKIRSSNITLYRTDELGTIVAESTGHGIDFSAGPINTELSGDEIPVGVPLKISVYITDTGEKYHSGGCRFLKKSQTEVRLEKAKSDGYTPCGICKPPE